MDELYDKLAEALEVDAVHPEDELRAFPTWDSLTALSVIAMLDTDYHISVNPLELASITTAAELKAFVEAHRS